MTALVQARHVAPLALALAVLAGVGCLSPTNPFDPEAPRDLQAKGSVKGTVILDAATTDPAALALELESVRIGIIDEAGEKLRRDGVPVALPLADASVAEGLGSGTFQLDELVPGTYVVVVENVGSFYTAPVVAPVEVLPGALRSVGELRFVLEVDGGGPGSIVGAIDADGAGQRTTQLYQLRADGIRLVDSVVSSGAFSFSNLAIGTYAIAAESEGFTPDFRLDVVIGEGEGASLAHDFSAQSALQLFPVSAVLQPALTGTDAARLDDGVFYVRGNALPLQVLAFGGVTAMRLSTSPDFVDDAGGAVDFVPFAAATSLPLPTREGTVGVFAQFEARSGAGFAFTSDVFSTAVVRDVSAPELLDGTTLVGLDVDADGTFLAGAASAGALNVRVDAQDIVSAVDALAVAAFPASDPPADDEPLVFTDVTAGSGRFLADVPLNLGADGEYIVVIAARDRAGNESARISLPVILDRSPPDVPLLVTSAVGGTQSTRVVELAFDEDAATADLPVAMQVGLQPLAPNAPIVPYATATSVVVDGDEIVDGQVAAFEARLIDRAGNVQLVQSADVTFSLAGRLAGAVVLEGAPELLPVAPVVVRALGGGGTGPVLASSTVDVDGSYLLTGVPEAANVVVEATADGWQAARTAVGAVPALDVGDAPIPVLGLTLPLARGDVTAAFRRQDLAADDTAHAGIGVSLVLTGSTRVFVDTGVTGPDGTVVFRGVPVTVLAAGGNEERYLLAARAEGYATGTAETTVDAGNNIVNPDGNGAATPVLLAPNVGDFDVCPGTTGPCVPSPFIGVDLVRVRLRDPTDVVQLRARAGTAFSTATSEGELPFLPFADPASLVLDLAALDDGLVEVFVQTRKSDGSVSDVLSTVITRDTEPPAPPAITRIPGAGAVDARFTRFGFVDLLVDGETQVGEVAPLDASHVVVADAAPAAVPAAGDPGDVRCGDDATCRVALPGPPGPVEEKLHRIFAWSCDAAGNCSDADGNPANGEQPVESFVIHDVTAPSSDHGARFDITSADLVVVGDELVLRSALYGATVDTGAAEDGLGGPVLDEEGAPVADVWAYRLSLTETAVDTQVRIFDPAPAAGETRGDVVAPALPAVDGTRRIFARFRDAAGNETLGAPNPFFLDVRIDTAPPLVGFRVASTAGNEQFTASPTVRIAVDVPPGGEVPSVVEIDNDDGLFDDDVDLVFPFANGADLVSLPVVAGSPDGLYPLTARVSDAAGNSTILVDAITLDRTGPAVLDLRCSTCTERDGSLFSRDVAGAATLATLLSDGGAGAAQLRVTVGAGPPQTVASTTQANIVLPLGTSTVVTVAGVDALGNATAAAAERALTIVHDATAPNVVVSLAGGATRTRSTVVQVGINATDATALVDMELSTTGSFTGAFVPFSPLTTVDVSSGGDGLKTVQVRVRDAAGNVGTGSASITLDRAAPNAALVLAGGAVATSTASVQAALTFDPADTAELAVSTSPLDCASAALAAAPASSPFTTTVDLGVGDGTKTVFACLRDAAGNARGVQDTILLDTTPPPSSIALDGGASHTLDTTVDVVVTTAADVTQAAFATGLDPVVLDCATATYTAFTPGGPTPTIGLSTGAAPVDGARTVRACFKDAAGNTSAAADDIILDRFAPTGTVQIDAGAPFARSRSVSVDISTVADVGLVAVAAGPLDCATAQYQTFSTPRVVTLEDADGTQTVNVCVKDGANRTALLSDTIILDRAPPTGSVSINGGASVTTARTVTVQLSYDADSVLVLASPVAIDCATAQSYIAATPPSSTIAVDLLGGRGFQPVFGCFKDAAGNTFSASDTIFFDESDVTGLTVAVNGGAEFATNRNVLVTLIAPPDATEAKIAEAGTLDCNNPTGYAPFSSPLALTLSAGVAPLEGARTVSACVKQGAATPLFAQDTIILDTFAPNGSLTLQGGAAATNSLQVVVSLTAASDVVDVSLTTAPTIDCAAVTYEPFTSTKAFALAGPDGTNTVRGCLRDAAGNTVQVSDSITLDRAGPSPVSVTAPSFVTTTTANATLSFPAGDTAQVAVAEGALDCATTAAYVAATGTRSVSLSAGDGTKTLVACFKDAAGNTSQAATQTVLDTSDPSGTVVIDAGAAFTTDTSVQLTLTAPADTTQMSIAEGSINCGTATFVAFVAQPNVTLTAANGSKTVAVCFRDAAGRTAQASDTIVLDTEAPTGTLAIDGGATHTRDRDVVLTITQTGGATDAVEVAVADGGTLACASATYVPFTPVLTRTLPSGDGTKQVAACLKDRAGNLSAASFAASIELDTAPPNAGNSSLSIAAGAAFTTSSTVSLTLTFPSDVTQRAIANDGLDCASATYVAAGTSPATINGHVLSAGDGTKVVVACVKDTAGNTFLVTDNISLDTVAPSTTDTSVTINGGAARTSSAALSVALLAPADVTQVAITEGAQTQAACDALASGFVPLSSPVAVNLANVTEGTKTISACFRENAGRRLVVSDTIFFDPNRPTLTSFTLDAGASATRDRDVEALVTGASNDVVSMFVADGAIADCSAVSPYVPFTPSFGRTLPASDGSKTVSICLKDETGNTSAAATSATITLDTAAPSGVAAVVNGGAAATNSATLSVALTYAVGAGQATQFALAEGSIDCATATRTALDGTSPDTVNVVASSGDGNKVLVACFFDAAGNVATAQDSILLDTTAPTGSILLAGGASFSTAASTPVTLTAPDDTSLVFLQVNGSAPTCTAIADGSYVAFPSTVALGADGAKTVFACFRDAAGNKSSAAVSDAITLDTTVPAITSFTGPTLSNSTVVTLTIAATDANTPLQMALGNNALNCSTASYTAFTSPVQHTILNAASTTVHLCVKDAAGNTTATSGSTLTISLDTTPPAGVTAAIQDGGDNFVTTSGATNVLLSWSTAGDVSSVKAAEGAIDCASGAGYTNVGAVTNTTLSVSLSSGDATKTVVACFRDAAGNIATAQDTTILDTQAPTGTIVVAGDVAKTRLTTSIPVAVTSSAADVTQMAIIDVTSGSAQTCANGTYVSFAASSTLAAFASATNNAKTVGVCFRDSAGNQSSTPAATDTITLDTTLVSTGISVALRGTKKDGVSDANLTRVQAVTVVVTGAASDIVGIELANDSTFAGASEDIFGNGVVYPFLLDPGDGAKDVFIRLTDDADNTITLSDNNPAGTDLNITLDTAAPSAPVVVLKSGDTFATSASVPITLTAQSGGAQDGTIEVRVSPNDTDFADTGEAFTGTFPTTVTLPGSDGTKSVFAQFRDEAGNETPVVSDTIALDTSAPVASSDIRCDGGTFRAICINSADLFTNSVSVTVEITSSVANGVATEMQIATDGTADSEPFIPYSTFVTVLLPAGDGSKTVAARFRDAAGNVSAAQSTDTITLDTVAPTGPRLATASAVTREIDQIVNLSAQSTDSNGFQYELFGGQFSDWTPTADTNGFVFELTNPSSSSAEAGDLYTLGVRAVDPAGNVSAESFITMTCDGNPPSTPTGLVAAARSGSVTLRWDRPLAVEPDVVGFLVRYGYDATDLTDTFAAEGPSPIFVAKPNGNAQPNITLTGLADNTPFSVTISAVDHAGNEFVAPNESPQTAPLTVLPNPVAPVVRGGIARGGGAGGHTIAVRGTRLYTVREATPDELCIYDVANPAAPALIQCKADASISIDDKIAVFGRFAYLYRNGASMRVVDVARLGGSSRTNPADVPVVALTDVGTSNVIDLTFPGDLTAATPSYAVALRPNGGDSEYRELALPAASGAFAPDLATVGSAVLVTGTPQAIDATGDLVAVVSSTFMQVHLSTAPNNLGRLTNLPGTIRDVKIENSASSIGDPEPRAATVYLGGDFGLRVHRVFFDTITPNVNFQQSALVQLGGFDCSSMAVAAGYVYCNDTSNGTSDSLVVVQLEPVPRVVGRLLADNTFVGSPPGTTIGALALHENMVFATLNDNNRSLAAIELAEPGRYVFESSTNVLYDEVLVDGNVAYAFSTSAAGILEGAALEILNPESPITMVASTGTAGSGCDTGTARRSRAQLFGRLPVIACSNGVVLSANNLPFNFADVAASAQAQPSRRAAGDVSRTRSFVVDGTSAYVVTNDSQIERWSLARPSTTGPANVITVAGATFSRPPVVQDDRLLVVDDAGVLRVFSLTDSADAPALIAAPVATLTVSFGGDTASDTTRFGDLEVRSGGVFVTRAVGATNDTGIFRVAFAESTGALGAISAPTARAFGAMAPIGGGLLAADGFFPSSALPGSVAGIFALRSDLSINTSSQAVLAPFNVTVLGPTVISVNRDSGLELMTLSR